MITITPQAAQQVRELFEQLKKAGEINTHLRVFVQGGGCSGFQYGLLPAKEADITDADKIIESNGIKLAVDPISIRYLENVTVDFVANEPGGGFTINNPNAKSTCGCGQSFSA